MQTINKAKELIEEAGENLEDGRYNSATVVAYLALFNSARALLFKDGYRERSHICIARYLEKKYKSKIPKNWSPDRHRINSKNVLIIRYSNFNIVSSFDIRISDLRFPGITNISYVITTLT